MTRLMHTLCALRGHNLVPQYQTAHDRKPLVCTVCGALFHLDLLEVLGGLVVSEVFGSGLSRPQNPKPISLPLLKPSREGYLAMKDF